MAIKKIIAPLASAFLSLFLLGQISLPPACLAGEAGAAALVTGPAFLKQKGSDRWVPLSKGDSVGEGDRVRTGAEGRVNLSLSDGTRLNIGNSSEVEITEFLHARGARSATYSLSTGKLRALIGRLSGSTDIKVRTPTAIAGVKGTDFSVINQGDANVLFGNSGSVGVSGSDSGSVDLRGGMMTENTRGASPIEPVKVDEGGELARARAILEASTEAGAPVEWDEAGKLPLIIARWNINYGHYLADSKRFREALDVFRIAIDLAAEPGLRAEAHLERGTVLAFGLLDHKAALAEFSSVIDKYPQEPFLEGAIFRSGTAYMDLGMKDEAASAFRKYLSAYPGGSHRESAESFLRVLEGR